MEITGCCQWQETICKKIKKYFFWLESTLVLNDVSVPLSLTMPRLGTCVGRNGYNNEGADDRAWEGKKTKTKKQRICCKYLNVKAARALSFLQLQPEENARVRKRWTSQTTVIPLVLQRTEEERNGNIVQKFHTVLEEGMERTQLKCRWSGPAVRDESFVQWYLITIYHHNSLILCSSQRQKKTCCIKCTCSRAGVGQNWKQTNLQI